MQLKRVRFFFEPWQPENKKKLKTALAYNIAMQ